MPNQCLYSRRAKRHQTGQPFEDQKLQPAGIKSWSHSFTAETVLGEYFLTRSDAKYPVSDYIYIKVYDNHRRLHFKLGYIDSEAFETRKSLVKCS
ncbi:IS3 family transposase [Methylobacter sp. BlB1]|uniref:IS3 family transposase n=1 Tax=Methylobacter sp. BlB1 TaxID=2785914 RepID=UPI00351ADE02